jgi:hypothetical protein
MTTPITHSQVQARNGNATTRALRYYFLAGLVLPFAIPEGYARSFPSLLTLMQWFDAAIPGIPKLAQLAPFPDVMRTFLIVMWLLLPFAAYRVARAWTWNPRLFALKRSDQWFVVGSSLLIAGFCFGFLYFFIDNPATPLESVGGRGGAFVRALTQYRIGLALAGTTFFCAIALTLGLALRLLYLVAVRTTPEQANAS